MKKLRCAVLALLGVVLIAPLLLGQDADQKIDPGLIAVLSGDSNATAPFFVLFTDKADLSAASRILDRAARARAVVAALRAKASLGQAGVLSRLQDDRVGFVPFWIENVVYVGRGNLALARVLAARPEVARIAREPVLTISEGATAASALASSDWNIRQVRADQAWSTTTGAGIVVATIDSGIRHTHTTLANQYRGKTPTGYNHAANWADPTGICGAVPCDNTGHGTMVMGLAVGSDGGSNQIGVAPGATWIACKGCSSNSACYGSHLMACGQWIMDPLGDGSGSNQPDVVNNSWSSAGGNAWFQDMVQGWRAAGIFPVFAAGNAGSACSTVGSPGDYAESYGVGATNSSDAIASFSARGPSLFGGIKPDLVAPGVNVRSADYLSDTGFFYGSGTSFSAPHVAGAVALVWSATPTLKGDITATEQLLGSTAVPLTSSENCGGTAYQVPNHTFGYGRLDALSAVLAAGPVPGPQATADSYAVAEDGSLSVPAPGVLANDTPASGLTAILVSNVASGVLTLNGNGSFTYAPSPNFHGSDSFAYRANNGTADSNVAIVTISVTPVNDPPVAADDVATATAGGAAININVLANDTDPDGDVLNVTQAVPSAGSAMINPDKTIRYTPPATAGKYTITYTISDGAATDTGVVTVTVTAGGNQPPVAVNDTATVPLYPGSANINVLANDYDPDGTLAGITLKIVTKAKKGDVKVVQVSGTYAIQYNAKRNQSGADSFTYTVKDNAGATSNVARVDVTIRLALRPGARGKAARRPPSGE